MPLEADTRYRALAARDPRFDGLFFVGVKTTGIYCRPVCPARTPRRERCTFFETAAAAERDGFRACFRCRPELAPGNAQMDATSRLVNAAVSRIAAGVLNEGSVEELAAGLGVTDRHLRRVLVEALGVSPVELAQTARLALAKRLLHDSSLGLAELAFASGFQSVRRFNSAFDARFHRSPTSVRREAQEDGSEGVRLRLDYRPPFSWSSVLRFFAARAMPGVEAVEGDVYRRTVHLGSTKGWLSVEPHTTQPALVATLSSSLLGELMPIVAKLRRVFDLDAHPAEVDACLSKDATLRPLVRAKPGLRVPGAFDGFETTVRAVLGQQVSVKGATTLAGRLVERFGAPVRTPFDGLRRVFPTAARLAQTSERELASIGLPGARARTLLELARAVKSGLVLEPGVDVEDVLIRLAELPGIGPWTTQYVAMRALASPDAFPASDLGVLKALKVTRAEQALERAESWRPWRAYATLHLWSLLEVST